MFNRRITTTKQIHYYPISYIHLRQPNGGGGLWGPLSGSFKALKIRDEKHLEWYADITTKKSFELQITSETYNYSDDAWCGNFGLETSTHRWNFGITGGYFQLNCGGYNITSSNFKLFQYPLGQKRTLNIKVVNMQQITVSDNYGNSKTVNSPFVMPTNNFRFGLNSSTYDATGYTTFYNGDNIYYNFKFLINNVMYGNYMPYYDGKATRIFMNMVTNLGACLTYSEV